MTYALLMQVGGAVPTSAVDMVRQASLVTRVVLVFLLVLSLVANIVAQWIVRKVARKHGVTRGGHA